MTAGKLDRRQLRQPSPLQGSLPNAEEVCIDWLRMLRDASSTRTGCQRLMLEPAASALGGSYLPIQGGQYMVQSCPCHAACMLWTGPALDSSIGLQVLSRVAWVFCSDLCCIAGLLRGAAASIMHVFCNHASDRSSTLIFFHGHAAQ